MKLALTIASLLLASVVGVPAQADITPTAVSTAGVFAATLKLPTDRISTNRGLLLNIGTVFRPSGTVVVAKNGDIGYGAAMMLPVAELNLHHTRWEAGPEYTSAKMLTGPDKGKQFSFAGVGLTFELSENNCAPLWLKCVTVGGAFQCRVDRPQDYGPAVWAGYRF